MFGLLANCIFSTGAGGSCPLSELRSNLSIEEKHKYMMGLSNEDVKSILVQHEECYKKKVVALNARVIHGRGEFVSK